MQASSQLYLIHLSILYFITHYDHICFLIPPAYIHNYSIFTNISLYKSLTYSINFTTFI